MALNSGNIYSIPEHPLEDDLNEESYSETVSETNSSKVTKKVSSTSLPEKSQQFPKDDLKCYNNSIPTLVTTETTFEQREVVTGCRTFHKDINRLSISLIDIHNINLIPDSGAFKSDTGNVFAKMASSQTISAKNCKSYLEVQDCVSHLNSEREYETLLSPSVVYEGKSNNESNPAGKSLKCHNKERKYSDNLVFIDLNEDSSTCQTSDDLSGPSVCRQRSRSMQWIQNTFQNVSSKYKFFLDLRRPSDIAEERMRKSKEELEMGEPEYEDIPAKSSPAGRRFSENVIGKQKRLFPFTSRLGHLKDLWHRNPVSRRQEEKDIDQTRTDVCPIFTFPRKCEDEVILDALRQAMRKCTAIDPTARPTSSIVLEQLSNLVD